MGVMEIIAAVNALIGIASNLYNMAQQVSGSTPIPTWDEIILANSQLQAKIDAEKVA